MQHQNKGAYVAAKTAFYAVFPWYECAVSHNRTVSVALEP